MVRTQQNYYYLNILCDAKNLIFEIDKIVFIQIVSMAFNFLKSVSL